MKKLIIILINLLFISTKAFAQHGETNKIFSDDTLKSKFLTNPLSEIYYKFDEFDFYRENKNLKMYLLLDEDPNTIWVRTSLLISKMDLPSEGNKADLLSPLFIQYSENSKFNPIRYMLGMAQIGAVGYLAYKHIIKYGLFK